MVDLDIELHPVFADSPEPEPFARIQARAAKHRQRRMRRVGFGAVAILAVSTAAVAAIVSRNRPDAVTVIAPPTMTADRLQIGPPTRISQHGMDMISAFGSIWVSRPDHVGRFDNATGRMTADIAVPGNGAFRNLAVGAGSIWLNDTGTQTVTRIDPERNAIAATIPVSDTLLVPDGLAFVDGKLWVARLGPRDSLGDVLSIDPATNLVESRTTIPSALDVMAGDHSLWYRQVVDLMRFDTITLRTTIVRRDVKALLAIENHHLWLLTAAGVVETDESTGTQIGPAIGVPYVEDLALAIGPDTVWIAGQAAGDSSARSVQPYDLVTHQPLAASVPAAFPVVTTSVVDNALWIDAGGITRIPFSRAPG